MTDATFDPRALRDAFGCFMTGVTVVTTIDPAGRPVGFTANSFTSVSMDPPLLLVSMSARSRSHAAFAEGRGFAVNILAEGQKAISANFARSVEDRFAEVYWRRGPVGSPLIADVSAWFDCTLQQVVAAGDHTLLIGRIGGFAATPAPGLGYYRGAYVTQSATQTRLPAGPDVVISAILVAEGEVLLADDSMGGLALPSCLAGREGVQASLTALIARSGVEAQPGFIYAVWDDVARGQQHIAFRCPAQKGARPRIGAFVELSSAGVANVTDPASRAMLERLAAESRMGNYNIYFGTHEQGQVTPIRGRD